MFYTTNVCVITGKSCFEHTPPLAKRLNLVLFNDLYDYYLAIFMFKLHNQMLPRSISAMFTYLSDVHIHSLRASEGFFLPRVRLSICKQFVVYSGVQCWSKLSYNLKTCKSVYEFKRMLYLKLSSNYA